MGETHYWQQCIDYATLLRRQLHQQPELSWQEKHTANTIRDALSAMSIEWRTCAELGTVATLAANLSGKHILLRADMDALPIEERSGVSWCSQQQGVMHACGHDGHTAVLLGTAKWLKAHEHQLTHPVSLIFQPAEEGGHGAREMIKDGALTGIDAIYGWHNWPAIPLGQLFCPEGTVMAGNATFEIALTGVGGHASQPNLCRDPVLTAAAITVNLQQIVARRLAPQTAAVVSVTAIDAPSGATTIPTHATLSGSIRVSHMDDAVKVGEWITQISQDTAASYGVECHVTHFPRYQPTVNHTIEAAHSRATWQALFGDTALDTDSLQPIMASEDFSYYLNAIPGAFALIGAGAHGVDHSPPCHSAYYDFNDQLIEPVMRWFSLLCALPTPSSK
ncbi:N(2)-acetyl-L-2,4-diaminobutanoate deacetylase DoeB2 [Photobacterium japonica]|uniref:N(2)-acetyl-L-2,4-diaminobutanoate deacetylase DoeB2 n=1 Tax=Photobacterium japonica TaxID=2910235 RepID=UPI003D09E581